MARVGNGAIGHLEIFLWNTEESRGYTACDKKSDFLRAQCATQALSRAIAKGTTGRQLLKPLPVVRARFPPYPLRVFCCVYFLYVNLCFLSHFPPYLILNNNKKSHRPFQD
jgi:hypothetical protein